MARQIVPHKLKKKISVQIKAVMKCKNITRNELVSVTDITDTSISKILNAINAPALDTLLSIADRYKVSVDFLLGQSKDPAPAQTPESPDDLKAAIGKRLDTLLERDSVSQYRLAKDLKKNQSAFAYIRNGKNAPALQTLIELADYFEVTTDYLLGRARA